MARSKKQKSSEKSSSQPAMKKGRGRPSKDGNKKKSKFNPNHFSYFLLKVLKQVHPDCGISKKAMIILNDMMIDMFQRIANEASHLTQIQKRPTLISRDIQMAVRFILPGELANHAISEGTKAVTKYLASRDQ